MAARRRAPAASWPTGGGEMGALVRAHDWAAGPLGPLESWPESLRAVVDLVLPGGFPMVALWGPELVQIYNAGYRTLMGKKHPAGFGQPTRDCWPEVWHINAPIYERVLRGETLTFEVALYPITRYGALEDAWFTLSYSPLRDGAGAIAGVLVTVVETSERLRADAALRESAVAEAVAAERQALLKQVVRAQEEERRRLSHDVHDSLTQLAHAAALRLDALAEDLAPTLPPEYRRDLERARDLTRSTARAARRLIAGLRPEALDHLGLVGALRAEVEALRGDGCKVAFRDGDLGSVRLGEEAEITLYRVAQEALTNVRKHAGSTSVHLELRRRNGEVRLVVRDRGRGFEPGAGPASGEPSRHMGVVGMRERVELLGGAFALRSAPGAGTRIEVRLPVALGPGGA